MRRVEREVKDINDIFDILLCCDSVRIGINGGDYPYVVPVSFGTELIGEKPVIYFHSAKEGKKLDMIRNNPNVCVEGDIFIRTEKNERGITALYESVIAFGRCRFAETEEEILHGLKLIIDHYGYPDYDVRECGAASRVKIGVIEIDSISGKHNIG